MRMPTFGVPRAGIAECAISRTIIDVFLPPRPASRVIAVCVAPLVQAQKVWRGETARIPWRASVARMPEACGCECELALKLTEPNALRSRTVLSRARALSPGSLRCTRPGDFEVSGIWYCVTFGALKTKRCAVEEVREHRRAIRPD